MKNQHREGEKKAANIIVQMGIFAVVLFVSQIISSMFPKSLVVPTPLIGMALLYILLELKIVKLEQVEKFGDFMIGLIAFLFVPSGVQLAAHLNIMRQEGLQDVIVIIISTIILLVVIAYTGALVMKIHHKITNSQPDQQPKEAIDHDKHNLV